MTRLIVATVVLAATAACGVGTEEQLGTQQQELRIPDRALPGQESEWINVPARDIRAIPGQDLREASMVRLTESGLQEYCMTNLVRPTTQGTIRYMPLAKVFDRLVETQEAEASYFATNSINEELRRGVVEFYVPGSFDSAVLHFREARGWTSYPMPTDTYLVMAFAGNLEFDVSDFATPAVAVARFETDPNLEPRYNVAYDLTKALREVGPKLGLRFQLENNVSGHGTVFADPVLEVTRCQSVRALPQ